MRKNKKTFFTVLITLIILSLWNNSFGEGKKHTLELNPGVEDLSFLSQLEKEVIVELNIARTEPAKYAEFVNEFKKKFESDYQYFSDGAFVVTSEGIDGVDEAVQFLKKIDPISPLMVSKGLSSAAKVQVLYQGPEGLTGHSGKGGTSPMDRMNRYGKWKYVSGENINYGNKTAREIVMQLIIDDGVKDRGHRMNIFNEDFHVVGVGCGPHAEYEWMCVMDFAGGYQEM